MPKGPIKSSVLVMCEGMADKNLLHEIFSQISPLNRICSVQFPNDSENRTGGISKIPSSINGILIESSDYIKLIIVVIDADEDRDQSFRSLKSALEEKDLAAPEQENVLSNVKNGYQLAIIVVPHRGKGAIENLCVESMQEKFPKLSSVDKLMDEFQVLSWPVQKQSKSKLHIAIALTCKKSPDATLSTIWNNPKEYHIPLSNDIMELGRRVKHLINICDATKSLV